MSDDMQTLPGNPADSSANPANQDAPGVEHDGTTTETDSSESETTRKRRRFRPDEIALAHRFIDKTKPGTPIAFTDLDKEMKQAVLPNKRTRLMDRGILEVEYDEENGLIKTVTVNPDILKDYEWDLTQPIAVTKPSVTKDPSDIRQRKPRNLLADPKYKIRKLTETNPRRAGSHGWYNWEYCYHDGQSVPEYLSQLGAPRNPNGYSRDILTSNGTYFNGPSTLFLEQDLRSKYIGIYDSSQSFKNDDGSDNESIWLEWADLERLPESEESSESDTTQEAAESETTPTESETAQ